MSKKTIIRFFNGDEIKLEKYDKWELKEGCFIIYDEGDVRIYPIATINEIVIGKWANDDYTESYNLRVFRDV